MTKKDLKGWVVELPDNEGVGVIIGSHRLEKDTYIASIIGKNRRVYWATLKANTLKVGTPIHYIKCKSYGVETVASNLKG